MTNPLDYAGSLAAAIEGPLAAARRREDIRLECIKMASAEACAGHGGSSAQPEYVIWRADRYYVWITGDLGSNQSTEAARAA